MTEDRQKYMEMLKGLLPKKYHNNMNELINNPQILNMLLNLSKQEEKADTSQMAPEAKKKYLQERLKKKIKGGQEMRKSKSVKDYKQKKLEEESKKSNEDAKEN